MLSTCRCPRVCPRLLSSHGGSVHYRECCHREIRCGDAYGAFLLQSPRDFDSVSVRIGKSSALKCGNICEKQRCRSIRGVTRQRRRAWLLDSSVPEGRGCEKCIQRSS